MSTITAEQQQAIRDYVNSHVLPSGIGSAESACSIASINLALTGRLTDEIPACMSLVIGRWIIRVQDAMPDDMRNSVKWKSLLPMAAGTGRNSDDEKRRLNIVLKWMWDTVLPQLQPLADKRGYGDKWKKMTDDKTEEAARDAAAAAAYADAYAAAAYAAAAAAYADAYAAAAYAAAAYADAYAAAAARNEFWHNVDPCGLLEQLVDA